MRRTKEKYPVGWQMGKPEIPEDVDTEEEAQEEESLPRRDHCIRIVINDKDMPETLFGKDEAGNPVMIRQATKAMYRIAETIALKLKFLPMPKVKIKIVRYKVHAMREYSSFIDVCLRIIYRAGVIECTSGTTVKALSVECIKSDREKVVILIEPVNASDTGMGSVTSAPEEEQPVH